MKEIFINKIYPFMIEMKEHVRFCFLMMMKLKVLKWKKYKINLYYIKTSKFPSGKYWSPGFPKDVLLQRPQDVPLKILFDHPRDIPIWRPADVLKWRPWDVLIWSSRDVPGMLIRDVPRMFSGTSPRGPPEYLNLDVPKFLLTFFSELIRFTKSI